MSGPVLEVEPGDIQGNTSEKPVTIVPDTNNNASLTISNQADTGTTKTGDALPVTALFLLGGSLGFCGVCLVSNVNTFKK